MAEPRVILPALDLATFRGRTVALLPPVSQLDSELDETVWQRLHAHYRLLCRWAPTINLIGHGAGDSVPQRHYGESLSGLSFLPRGPCFDLGSGAGFPGLILAACRPQQDFVLIEARQRKAAFLRRAVQTMGLDRCSVLSGRWGPNGLDGERDQNEIESRSPFSALTARAIRLHPWLDSLDKVLAPDARWLAWGEGAEPATAPSWSLEASVALATKRRLAIYRRVTRARSAPA